MKKIMILPVIALSLGLAGCGNKDSTGKEFEASINKDKVMLNSNYNATVKLKTNKNAVYEVQNGKGNDIQSDRKTSSGKVDISLNKPGKYKIIAKSDNGKVKKKLPVEVVPYTVSLNKTTSSVGPLQFRIKNIEYKQIKKTKEPNSDALYNMDDYSSLNDTYYQVKINYEVRNNGNKTIDPTQTLWNPIDDNGTEFQSDGSADSYFYDTVAGGSKIAPKSHRAGVIYMISNNKFSVRNLKINVGDIYANDDEQIGDSGVANLN